MKLLFITFFFMAVLQQSSFRKAQLQYSRVKIAYDEKEQVVKKYFDKTKIDYTGFSLFLRAFKREMILEAWVKEKNKNTFTLLHTYDFCATSGSLGPKRKEGDMQIPEGVYSINHFNPESNFYLSLGINYPNASDNILSDKRSPGGSIYIHGNCVTVGCIPITDDKIKELYIMAVEARNGGQEKIPVHIFPSKLDELRMNALRREFQTMPQLIKFWESLQLIYQDFENSFILRPVKINDGGEYRF